MNMIKPFDRRLGFTIVELLIVIVVIGILAAIATVAYSGIQQRAHMAVLQTDFGNASRQLEIDNVQDGTYPASAAAANDGQGLKASQGTTWQYTYTSADNSYCITGTNSGVSYFISTTNKTPQAGACPGHVNGGIAALVCPTGFIVVPGSTTYGTSEFCVMKYEAKNVSGVATSQASGSPWVSISQTAALTTATAACSGCHLITEAEWMTLAQNVLSVSSNWSGGSVGSGSIYRGHNDSNPANTLAADTNDANGYSGTGNSSPSNQRRTLTLTNGEVIWDLAGNAWEWTSGTTTTGQPGITGESGYSWKAWTAVTTNGSLSIDPSPTGTGLPGANTWNSLNGIGDLYSYSGETAMRGFFRGGMWSNGMPAGVLLLQLSYAPSNTFSSLSFRVSR